MSEGCLSHRRSQKRRASTFGSPLAIALLITACFGIGNAFAQNSATHFDISAFDIAGNSVLSADEVEAAVYPFTGPNRTTDDVEAARAALQAAYEAKGFAMVTVSLPEQGIDTGVITLEVAEQRIGELRVEGARFSDPVAVRSAAPALAPGTVPNFDEVQRNIVALNRSADRRVTPEIVAGTAPGTIDVVLTVDEKRPVHGSLEVNNRGSAQTTSTRASASLRHDNLWGRGDSVGISLLTAPERQEDGTVYSANYMARLPWHNLLLSGYAVHSESDIAVVGGINVIGAGDLGGLRLIVPLPGRDGFFQSATFGLDYKSFDESVLLGADQDSVPIEYAPVSLAWRGDWVGDKVRSDLGATFVFGTRGIGDGKDAFDRKRFNARPNFFYVRGEGGHVTDIAHAFQISARANAQWSFDPLISNEQFSIGGPDSARGYYDSEALGDYGFSVQNELRSPSFASALGSWVNELRAHAFWDVAAAGIRDPLPDQENSNLLMGVGLGIRAQWWNYLNGSVDVARPLMDGPSTKQGDTTVHIRLWGEF